MKKKILYLILCFIIAATNPLPTNAATTDIEIIFSNIGSNHGTIPSLYQSTPIPGKSVDGVPMIRITDLANVLGCTITYFDYTIISRNGNIVFFDEGSTNYFTQMSYSIKNPANSTVTDYFFSKGGTAAASPCYINGSFYVPLKTAVDALGVLMCVYNNNQWKVFDFRVDGTTPKSDSNSYVVGGKWFTNWSTYGNAQLTPNFNLSTLWDHSSAEHEYKYQIKISTTLLQCLENVKYHYGSSGMTVPNAYRSWKKNEELYAQGLNPAVRSYHLRGRAFDADQDALYTSVYNEFKSTSTTPIDCASSGWSLWRTRVYSTGNSGGYEIEKMESHTNKWLHLQVKPGVDEAPANP